MSKNNITQIVCRAPKDLQKWFKSYSASEGCSMNHFLITFIKELYKKSTGRAFCEESQPNGPDAQL
jgi:hypothetical protein